MQINKIEAFFTPLKLELTIESEDELKELWHRMAVALSNVLGLSNGISAPSKAMSDELWIYLNQHVKKCGVK